MTFKYQLRLVAFTWPNLCLWAIILCPELKPKNLKNSKKNLGFTSPGPFVLVRIPATNLIVSLCTDTRTKNDDDLSLGNVKRQSQRLCFDFGQSN